MSETVYQALSWIIPLIFAIVPHEVAHGWVARYYGDQTAARMGRLTLNPIKHVDVIGTLILPMVLALAHAPVFGWAKGVPVDPRGMRNPRWNMVAVALAGPMMNIFLAAASVVVLAFILPGLAAPTAGAGIRFVAANLVNFIAINLFLAVFNLLPIPPFDGSKVLAGILPPALGERFSRLDRWGMLFAILLLVVLPQIYPKFNLVGRIVGTPVIWILNHINALLGQVIL
jgi:Zn-dependent protease